MLSKRPYLVPAFYDWIVDQGHVPHLVVDATVDGVMVPGNFVEEGHIQLNVSPSAVRDFHMDRVGISFEARFGGQPERIFVPMPAIRAIVDRDSGQGATFPDEPGETFPDDEGGERAPTGTPASKPGQGAPHLRAVPGGGSDEAAGDDRGESPDGPDAPDGDDGNDPDDDPPPSGGGKGGGPSLRVVK
ncbi:ClpXP protease specificity-enhancing factor SspB [Guyparkeria sp. 1SP6A2]|nr:ClpXP protease specificity-enhancing factor SspB [Guyparkeria sp. 1SP6A2]